MTEREIRLCIAGTVSEARSNLLRLNEQGAPEKIMELISAALDELSRAKMYAEALAKVQVS